MLFSDALDGFFLHMHAAGYSASTVLIYKTYLNRFVARHGNVEISSITTQDITGYLGWLASEYVPVRKNGSTAPMRPASISNAWCGFRSFFEWYDDQYGTGRPDLKVPRPKFKQEHVEPYTREECAALISASRQVIIEPKDGKKKYVQYRSTAERNAALVLTLLDTGMRIGELCRLEAQDCALTAGTLTIKPFGSGQKTSGRMVVVGKGCQHALWQYLAKRKELGEIEPTDPLFATIDGLHMSRGGATSLILRIGERAGVAHVHPHRFRHTFAVEFLRNGGDALMLQRLLGHTTLDMTSKYVKYVNSDNVDAIRRSGVVDRWKLK